MTRKNIISRLSIVCALCAMSGYASAAPSVRTLGGAGTVNGTAAVATTGGSSAINAVRGGSLRMTGGVSTPTRISASNTATTAASAGTRLSIGKYLGSANNISISTPSATPGTLDPAAVADINSRIDQVEHDIDNMQAQVDALDLTDVVKSSELSAAVTDELAAQGVATQSDISNLTSQIADKADASAVQNIVSSLNHYQPLMSAAAPISIENNNIVLDVSALADTLKNAYGYTDGDDGREVEIGYNDEYIRWRYIGEGDTAWRNLVAKADLVGAAGADGASAAEVVAAAQDSINTAVANAVSDKFGDLPAGKTVAAVLDTKADAAVVEDLGTAIDAKANATDVYTKNESDEKFAQQSNTYTKAEVDALIPTGGGTDYQIEDDLPCANYPFCE